MSTQLTQWLTPYSLADLHRDSLVNWRDRNTWDNLYRLSQTLTYLLTYLLTYWLTTSLVFHQSHWLLTDLLTRPLTDFADTHLKQNWRTDSVACWRATLLLTSFFPSWRPVPQPKKGLSTDNNEIISNPIIKLNLMHLKRRLSIRQASPCSYLSFYLLFYLSISIYKFIIF